jgi:phage-related baseplate assembly protein
MTDAGEQDSPIMDGAEEALTDGGLDDKARGILDQTEFDLTGHPEGDVLAALRQRFSESSVPVSDDVLVREARRIASGSA